MTTKWRASLWVLSLLLLPASGGLAQSDAGAPSGPPPAHLSVTEGQAWIDREGRSDPAVANLPLLDGDRLRTADGRIEVILPDGSLLHVDRATTVDLLAADLFRLLQGRVSVIVRGARDPQGAVRYQIDTPVASVQTGGPGEYRVWSSESARGPEVELAVISGQAILASESGAEEVRAGERSTVRDGLAPTAPQYFNSARWDDFGSWSVAQRDERLGTVSVQYLPAELTVYASTFDQYGTWRSEPDEGAVWYPTVAADWRPYSVGYWASYPGWDAFWIGGDPWGWPTHHYGHWGFSFSSGWYWRPARMWGPAWVSWAYSPGYVSWCPLGRHGDPVFGHFGVRGHYGGNHVDPWRGWTVVPRHRYGTATPMHRVAVDGNRLGPGARSAFAAGHPGIRLDRGMPRANAGGLPTLRSPSGGGTAAPRGSLGGAPPRRGQPAAPAERNASSVPRADGGNALPDGGARLSPDAAARILAGSGARTSGAAVRRPLPGAPAQFGSGTPAQFGSGSPTQFGDGAPAQFGGARTRSYPRANPTAAPSGASERPAPPAVRQNPYIGGNGTGGGIGTIERRAYPRAAEPPAGSAPRSSPYMGGSGAGAPAPSARPHDGGSSAPPPSARPREGGGISGGPAVQRGGTGGSSAPPSSPRYNPGSGASQPRSGSSAPPPPRRRGGNPD